MTARIPVTAIVLTLNEERNIGACLNALQRVDDIVVVDSGSTDATIELARKSRPDVRFFENGFEDFGQQRNWALDHAEPKHDWILFVDADEFCDDAFTDELARFVESPGSATGAYIAGRGYFLGRWIRHCTLYPSYQLRLLKHGRVRFRKEGHGQREVTDAPERLIYFKQGWRHEAFSKGIHQWVARHNEYSTGEIELLEALQKESIPFRKLFSRDAVGRRRALKVLAAKLPARPLLRFLYTYFLRLGILDGKPGLIFCQLRFAHEIHIAAKLAERKQRV